jgi:hypothetical protein
MDGSELSKEVARLEARMEKLAEVIERCRKVDLASKAAIALGAALLLAILLGIVKFHPVALIASVTMLLGGVVLFGSNNSTSETTAAALKAADAERAELIGQIDLRVVDDGER